MDYEGQKLCENLFYYIILIFGAIGWVYGYIEQDFVYVFYAWSVGMVISVVVSFLFLSVGLLHGCLFGDRRGSTIFTYE